MQSPLINYSLIQKAVEYYESCGYQYIEVPWVVSPEALNITRPANLPPIDSPRLVASGEQSFLEMILKGELGKGKFCCATPCYRPGDQGKDPYHFDQFFKVELISNKSDDTESDRGKFIIDAMGFFQRRGVRILITMPEDEERAECTERYSPMDLVAPLGDEEIELGSYGVRWNKNTGYWVYGTGLALPRFQQVLDGISQNKNQEG